MPEPVVRAEPIVQSVVPEPEPVVEEPVQEESEPVPEPEVVQQGLFGIEIVPKIIILF